MDLITSRLDLQFGSFPEPVIFLAGGRPCIPMSPGSSCYKAKPVPWICCALAEHPSGSMEIALGQATYRVTVSPFEMGDLLVLRPLPQPEEKKHPFSNAVYRMRECLSNFTAVQWKMKRVLEENHLMGDFDQDLANQSRLIFQMLRLTRQAELTQELNDKAFPREEGFDLAMVCQGMADETTWLADLAGVRFSYSSNVEHLPFQGSKSLLTQMLLALVSNGVRAAGKEGEVEMKLHAEHGRCVISVRDSGVGIPEDRMATSFLETPQRKSRGPARAPVWGCIMPNESRPFTAASWSPRVARTAAPAWWSRYPSWCQPASPPATTRVMIIWVDTRRS